MELAGLIVAFAAAAAAIAGAVFAFVQANEAVKARDDARSAEADAVAARDAAVMAQQQAAANSGRIAAVLEQQADAARAAASVRPDPWTRGPVVKGRNTRSVLLTLSGTVAVEDISVEVEGKPYFWHLDPQPLNSIMRPGDAIKISYMRAGGDPRLTTVELKWRWSDSGETSSTRATLE